MLTKQFSNWKSLLHLYSSDLTRAIETTNIIYDEIMNTSNTNANIVITNLLREKCYGILQGLPKNTTIEEARIYHSQKLSIDLFFFLVTFSFISFLPPLIQV